MALRYHPIAPPNEDLWDSLERTGVVSVTESRFGARGDGVADDTAAIQAAIDYAVANKLGAVLVPYGNYRTTAPLYVTASVALLGAEGKIPIIRPAHGHVDGTINVQSVAGGAVVKNLRIYPANDLAVPFYGLKIVGPTYTCYFDNIQVYYAEIAIWLTREANALLFRRIYISHFITYGIKLELDSGAVPAANVFHCVAVNGGDSDSPGRDTWGIYCDGSVNEFYCGTIDHCRYPFETNGTENTFDGYIEHVERSYKVNGGVHFVKMHAYAPATPNIDQAKAKVVGPWGLDESYISHAPQPRISWNQCKGLWLFGDGAGASYAQDFSGLGHPIPYLPATSWRDGCWGPSANVNFVSGEGPGSVPVGVADWGQPFTVAIKIRTDDYVQEATAIEWSNDPTTSKYTRLVSASEYVSLIDWDNSTAIQHTVGGSSPFTAGDGTYRWMIVGIDPAAHKTYCLDPYFGYDERTFSRGFSALGASALTINLGRNVYNEKGHKGGIIAFFGVWQRILSMSEMYDLVNSKLPPLPPPGVSTHGQRVSVPANASDPGIPGQWAADATHVYHCVAANTWVRAALATWP